MKSIKKKKNKIKPEDTVYFINKDGNIEEFFVWLVDGQTLFNEEEATLHKKFVLSNDDPRVIEYRMNKEEAFLKCNKLYSLKELNDKDEKISEKMKI